MKRRDHLEDTEVNWKIILKESDIWNKQDVRTVNGFNCLRIRCSRGRALTNSKEPCSSIKQEISWLPERSKICSLESVVKRQYPLQLVFYYISRKKLQLMDFLFFRYILQRQRAFDVTQCCCWDFMHAVRLLRETCIKYRTPDLRNTAITNSYYLQALTALNIFVDSTEQDPSETNNCSIQSTIGSRGTNHWTVVPHPSQYACNIHKHP
jgi:hypothetical protein